MIDFRKHKRQLRGRIEAGLGPILDSRGFELRAECRWVRDLGWALFICSLDVRRVASGLFLDVIGGAGIFLPDYHLVLQPDFMKYSSGRVPPATIGGPHGWIDERLSSEDARFTSLDEFEVLLPKHLRAFEERVLPEFERYQDEPDLFRALRQDDWLESVRFSTTQDRRAGLVTLMLAKYEGREAAIHWARAELERIRAQDPARPIRWSELQRALEHLLASER